MGRLTDFKDTSRSAWSLPPPPHPHRSITSLRTTVFSGECEEMMQHMRDVVGGTAGSSMLTQPPKATALSAIDFHELSRKQAARIAVKTKGGTLFIGSSDVVAVVAQGNYVLLVCESGSHRLRESISEMEEKLKAYGFVRIHRSVLVNKVWVDEIRPYAPTKYLLRLKNGKEFIVTRTYKGNFKSLAELWLGNDTFHGG